jgi:hypothetical protein
MCGLPVEGDSSLIPLYSVFLGLAGVAMILRIVARVVTQAYFWWDDFANLFGFVCGPCLRYTLAADTGSDWLGDIHCHEHQMYVHA